MAKSLNVDADPNAGWDVAAMPVGVPDCSPGSTRTRRGIAHTGTAPYAKDTDTSAGLHHHRDRRWPMSRTAVRHRPGVAAAIRKRGVRDGLRAVGRETRVSPIACRDLGIVADRPGGVFGRSLESPWEIGPASPRLPGSAACEMSYAL